MTERWLVTWDGYSETACIAVVAAHNEDEARAAARKLVSGYDPTAAWQEHAIERGSAYRIDHDLFVLQDAPH